MFADHLKFLICDLYLHYIIDYQNKKNERVTLKSKEYFKKFNIHFQDKGFKNSLLNLCKSTMIKIMN